MSERKPPIVLRIVYQEAGDALYMYLRPDAEVHRTVSATEDIMLDLDSSSRVIGIEVLGFMALAPGELGLTLNKYPTFNNEWVLDVLQQVRDSIEGMQKTGHTEKIELILAGA